MDKLAISESPKRPPEQQRRDNNEGKQQANSARTLIIREVTTPSRLNELVMLCHDQDQTRVNSCKTGHG